MATCEVCGNEYDKTLDVTYRGETHTFDSFECAIHAQDGLDSAGLAELARVLAERNAQLQQALDSRIVIEQAKGVLAERFSVSPDEAFQLLRRGARNHRVRIHALALRVVENPETPPELSELVSR